MIAMITFNKVFLLTPEGERLMISQIESWGFCQHSKKTWICTIANTEDSIKTSATVSEIDEAICLAHGLAPGAPMMQVDHSKQPVQPDN